MYSILSGYSLSPPDPQHEESGCVCSLQQQARHRWYEGFSYYYEGGQDHPCFDACPGAVAARNDARVDGIHALKTSSPCMFREA